MKVFDTIAANDIAERVVDAAVVLEHTGLPDDELEISFTITPDELRRVVLQALEDYSDAQEPAPSPPPVVDWKRHSHKRVEKNGRAVCEGCGVDL